MQKNYIDLTGKVALVTGAATGIGAAIAKTLAHAGAVVLLTDINQEAGELTTDSLLVECCKADFCSQDVAQEADWQRVIDAAVTKLGSLDILVNNAGILMYLSRSPGVSPGVNRVPKSSLCYNEGYGDTKASPLCLSLYVSCGLDTALSFQGVSEWCRSVFIVET